MCLTAVTLLLRHAFQHAFLTHLPRQALRSSGDRQQRGLRGSPHWRDPVSTGTRPIPLLSLILSGGHWKGLWEE